MGGAEVSFGEADFRDRGPAARAIHCQCHARDQKEWTQCVESS